MAGPSKRHLARGGFGFKDLPVKATLAAFLVLIVPAASFSQDTVFKCGDRNVSLGDSKIYVLNTCGKPDWSDLTGTKETGVRETDDIGRLKFQKDTVKVEKWYYNRGYGDFIYVLTFEADTLKAIERGGRGR